MIDIWGHLQRGKEVLVSHIKEPRLKGVLTHDFIIFCRVRVLYKKQFAEKNKHEDTYDISTLYQASLENSDLGSIFNCRMD